MLGWIVDNYKDKFLTARLVKEWSMLDVVMLKDLIFFKMYQLNFESSRQPSISIPTKNNFLYNDLPKQFRDNITETHKQE